MEVTEYYLEEAPDVHITENPLTYDWFIEGQKGESLPYVRSTFPEASKMLQAVVHYNKTGVPKTADKFKPMTKKKFKKRKGPRSESNERRIGVSNDNDG